MRSPFRRWRAPLMDSPELRTAHPERPSNSPCGKTCRPYVSAGTCRESVCRGRWRHRPQPPIYRAYAPPETVREPFWRRSRADDKPPDGPENRNEHGAEQSPATACRIGGRSRRSYCRLAGAVQHSFECPHGDAQQAPDLDRRDVAPARSRVAAVSAQAEEPLPGLWNADCQLIGGCHSHVLSAQVNPCDNFRYPFRSCLSRLTARDNMCIKWSGQDGCQEAD